MFDLPNDRYFKTLSAGTYMGGQKRFEKGSPFVMLLLQESFRNG